MISNGKMANLTNTKQRKRSVPIYFTVQYGYLHGSRVFDRCAGLNDHSLHAYIIAQLPSFLYIVCLLLISMLLSFLMLYIEKAVRVSDLDAMMDQILFCNNHYSCAWLARSFIFIWMWKCLNINPFCVTLSLTDNLQRGFM